MVVLVFLSACPGPTAEPMADAAIDGAPSDADAGDATDGPPGELDGDWSVTWACVDACAPEPELLRTQDLEIGGGALRWHSLTCADCEVTHVGVSRDTCLDVPAGRDNDLDDRDAYSMCLSGAAVSAEIRTRRIGGNPITSVWRATGQRR